jgi:hypothetical protein
MMRRREFITLLKRRGGRVAARGTRVAGGSPAAIGVLGRLLREDPRHWL